VPASYGTSNTQWLISVGLKVQANHPSQTHLTQPETDCGLRKQQKTGRLRSFVAEDTNDAETA